MNKLINGIVALMLAISPALAQNDAISKYFSQYESGENITTISFSGKAFEMLEELDSDDSDAQQAIKMASQVESLRIIIDDNHENAKGTVKTVHKSVANHFEDLMTISDKDANVYVMVDEANGIVNELLVLIGSDNEFIIASVVGQMKLSDVGQLTSQLSNAKSDLFSSSSIKSSDIKVYPNPVRHGENVTIDIPETLQGGMFTIYDGNGKEKMAYKINNRKERIDSSTLGKGVFIVKLSKNDVEVTSKLIVE